MTAIKLGRRPLRRVKYTGRYSGVLAHIADSGAPKITLG
jgi:hypothetical protein